MQKTRDYIILKRKTLLACGYIGPAIFILVFLLEGLTREGYNSSLYPISSLAIGNSGWIQVTNFILTGILLSAFAVGLRITFHYFTGKFHGPMLIGLAALGLIGAGIFSTDPLFGYPQQHPILLAQFTLHGHLHNLLSLLVFVCLSLACFSFRKIFLALRENGWATYSLISGILIILLFGLAGLGFKQISLFAPYAGIFQRLSVLSGLVWMAMLSIHLLRSHR